MKQQRMKNRYETHLSDIARVAETVRKRNLESKAQIELEGVQKIQNYQKQALTVEVGMLDKIVK